MNFKLIIAVAVALTGSAIFGCMISYRGHLTESWMRSLDSWLAFAILAGAFIVAYRVKDGDG
jgi:ABC-type dipeptide/oligopeptide/nickel transport system permease subunit